MISRNAPARPLHAPSAQELGAEAISPTRGRSCATCHHRVSCSVARYTEGEVAICSLWEERKSAA